MYRATHLFRSCYHRTVDLSIVLIETKCTCITILVKPRCLATTEQNAQNVIFGIIVCRLYRFECIEHYDKKSSIHRRTVFCLYNKATVF